MSDCSCIWVDSGDDMPEIHSEYDYTAKKQHKCSECGRIIMPGEKYEYVFGVWDGIPSIYKTCRDCQSVRNAFFCEGWLYSMIWDNVWEHLREINGNLESDCLLSLTKPSRDRVCDMIEKTWEDIEDVNT